MREFDLIQIIYRRRIEQPLIRYTMMNNENIYMNRNVEELASRNLPAWQMRWLLHEAAMKRENNIIY